LNIILLAVFSTSSQNYYKVPLGYAVQGKIVNGDTVYMVEWRQVTVIPPFEFKNDEQRDRYSKLVRYVKKVYPYSQIIKHKFAEMNANLQALSTKKQKKEYIDKVEKELTAEFEGQLKSLTFTQGRILIKLVDRETGKTTYEVVKQLKGSFSAFFWQSIARLFGSNLKAEYDADGDDKMIEDIIVRIENGVL